MTPLLVRTVVSATMLAAIVFTLLATPLPAQALPLPLPTPGVPPTAGETDLVPLASGNVNVDWMVQPLGPGFRYFFQIENLSGALINVFSVVAPALTPATASGALPGDNLDVATAQHALGHNVVDFGGLAGEEEPTAGAFPVGATAISGAGAVTWTFGAFLPGGQQSDTLYFDALTPPVYGGASLTGFTFVPVFGVVVWGTAPGEEVPVPSTSVPVPEPTTLLLVGVGLVGAGVWGRRRFLGSRRTSNR